MQFHIYSQSKPVHEMSLKCHSSSNVFSFISSSKLFSLSSFLLLEYSSNLINFILNIYLKIAFFFYHFEKHPTFYSIICSYIPAIINLFILILLLWSLFSLFLFLLSLFYLLMIPQFLS